MAAIEAIAAALGVVYIILAIRQRRECWIAGGASTALYVIVFARAGLPLQAALQVLYVMLAVYGWLQWRPAGPLPERPRSWPPARHLIALAAVGGTSMASAALVARYQLSAAPLADSLGTWASVVATWLLARRYLETWLWWIAVDAGLAALFAGRALYLTAALYLAFAVLALAGWRSWRQTMAPGDDARIGAIAAKLGLVKPVMTPLGGGPANRTLRLRDARNDLVLRLSGAASTALHANHEAEHAMHELAARHGLAPAVVMAQAGEGILVTHHAQGRTLAREDLRDAATLRRVGDWIARLHSLAPPAGLPVVDFGERAAGYLERLVASEAGAHVARLAKELERRRASLASPARLSACHHDLHHRNFIDSGDSLLVVDWEYGGPGDAAADLASCIGYHELDAGAIGALLAGYGADSRELRARLDALAWIFDCLWYGWNAASAIEGLECDATLQDRLAARLLS